MAGAGECAGQVGAVPVPATRLVAQLTLVNIMTTTLTRSVACRAGAAVATCSHGASQVMHRGRGGGVISVEQEARNKVKTKKLAEPISLGEKRDFCPGSFISNAKAQPFFLDSKSVLGYETASFAKLKIRETA